jgi:hypothetical protein
MTQRTFVQGGLKLIGFWLLITATLSLASSITKGSIAYYSLHSNPHTFSMGLGTFSFYGGPETSHDEMIQGSRFGVDWCTAQVQFLSAALQMLFALYLCKGGQLMLTFLMGKEDNLLNNTQEGIHQHAK